MIKIIVVTFLLFLTLSFSVQSEEGHSTLPGWSAGYRYYFDMDEDQKSHMRLFGKYKQVNGNSFQIGWDRQTCKDINQFNTNIDDDGVIFFEQEIKF